MFSTSSGRSIQLVIKLTDALPSFGLGFERNLHDVARPKLSAAAAAAPPCIAVGAAAPDIVSAAVASGTVDVAPVVAGRPHKLGNHKLPSHRNLRTPLLQARQLRTSSSESILPQEPDTRLVSMQD
ncbi:hypothetical protein WICPIJ_009661 [Wickerhamomyces pijperi]|uniref:Uncharacterized protein n=1 Tax=Wickerhamomyces pijperi TaxID=599730 RepID=A0A9P8PKP1_WICPI|nr:hypothetical protein WICPIJ_009661 [Wickerhamomyces pijperi]